MRSTIVLAAAIICVCAITSVAQLPVSTPDRSNVPTYAKRAQEGPQGAERKTLEAMRRDAGAAAGIQRGRAIIDAQMAAMVEAEEANRLKFGPPRDYQLEFQEYLNTKADTSLERIFEFKNCGTGKVVTLAEIERCSTLPQIREGGSYLSFRCKEGMLFDCVSKNRADIRYKGGSFTVGDGIVQGIIGNLGDVSIDSVTASHPAAKFLADYDFKQTLAKIAEQDKTLAAGIVAEGYRFSNSAHVSLNSTYVMRSVLYRHRQEGQFFFPPRGSDVRVVFKVVGIEPDGSAVILVKELSREYPRRQINK